MNFTASFDAMVDCGTKNPNDPQRLGLKGAGLSALARNLPGRKPEPAKVKGAGLAAARAAAGKPNVTLTKSSNAKRAAQKSGKSRRTSDKKPSSRRKVRKFKSAMEGDGDDDEPLGGTLPALDSSRHFRRGASRRANDDEDAASGDDALKMEMNKMLNKDSSDDGDEDSSEGDASDGGSQEDTGPAKRGGARTGTSSRSSAAMVKREPGANADLGRGPHAGGTRSRGAEGAAPSSNEPQGRRSQRGGDAGASSGARTKVDGGTVPSSPSRRATKPRGVTLITELDGSEFKRLPSINAAHNFLRVSHSVIVSHIQSSEPLNGYIIQEDALEDEAQATADVAVITPPQPEVPPAGGRQSAASSTPQRNLVTGDPSLAALVRNFEGRQSTLAALLKMPPRWSLFHWMHTSDITETIGFLRKYYKENGIARPAWIKNLKAFTKDRVSPSAVDQAIRVASELWQTGAARAPSPEMRMPDRDATETIQQPKPSYAGIIEQNCGLLLPTKLANIGGDGAAAAAAATGGAVLEDCGAVLLQSVAAPRVTREFPSAGDAQAFLGCSTETWAHMDTRAGGLEAGGWRRVLPTPVAAALGATPAEQNATAVDTSESAVGGSSDISTNPAGDGAAPELEPGQGSAASQPANAAQHPVAGTQAGGGESEASVNIFEHTMVPFDTKRTRRQPARYDGTLPAPALDGVAEYPAADDYTSVETDLLTTEIRVSIEETVTAAATLIALVTASDVSVVDVSILDKSAS